MRLPCQGFCSRKHQLFRNSITDNVDVHNRGISKFNLGDNQGAINDFRQAAKLYQQQNNQEWYQSSLDRLKESGVSN